MLVQKNVLFSGFCAVAILLVLAVLHNAIADLIDRLAGYISRCVVDEAIHHDSIVNDSSTWLNVYCRCRLCYAIASVGLQVCEQDILKFMTGF